LLGILDTRSFEICKEERTILGGIEVVVVKILSPEFIKHSSNTGTMVAVGSCSTCWKGEANIGLTKYLLKAGIRKEDNGEVVHFN
jgi:hypothetical protein